MNRWYPQRDSNSFFRLERPVVYRITYGGKFCSALKCASQKIYFGGRAGSQTQTPWVKAMSAVNYGHTPVYTRLPSHFIAITVLSFEFMVGVDGVEPPK